MTRGCGTEDGELHPVSRKPALIRLSSSILLYGRFASTWGRDTSGLADQMLIENYVSKSHLA